MSLESLDIFRCLGWSCVIGREGSWPGCPVSVPIRVTRSEGQGLMLSPWNYPPGSSHLPSSVHSLLICDQALPDGLRLLVLRSKCSKAGRMLAKFFFSRFFFFFCLEFLFPPSPVEVLQSNTTGFQSQIPWGVPVPLLDPLAGETDMGFRTFTTVGERLWYYCSPVYRLFTQWVWDLISLWLLPSYGLVAASPLSLNVGHLSLVGSSILLSMAIQQPLQLWFQSSAFSEVECVFFYSTILKQSPL